MKLKGSDKSGTLESVRNEGETNMFLNGEKLREFVTSRPVLKEWLMKVLETERK